MVERDIKGRGVKDRRVLEVMSKVPRHLFVDEHLRDRAYADHPLPISEGQTISQPYVVALMTEALSVTRNDRVLEIGTGSGYQAAVLAEMVKEVYTIEIRKGLAEEAMKRLADLGYRNVREKYGDGYYGWEEYAPFDAIIITAAANHLPPPLVKQLKEGGRLIVPLGSTVYHQTLTLLTKRKGELDAGSSLVATLLGTGVAILFVRFRFRGRWILLGLSVLPLIVPFVVLIMLARLIGVDPQVEEAAMDLGATYPAALRLVLLPAIEPAIFGKLTGHILLLRKTEAEKNAWIFVMGSMLLFAGAFLNNYMPINKQIWTTPYALFMAGMVALTFGCCYWLVDICGYRRWARPFAIYGMNAIAVYVLRGLFTKTLINIKVAGQDGNPIGIYGWIFANVFAPFCAPANASLAFALCYSFLFFLVSWLMYRRKWFVRI